MKKLWGGRFKKEIDSRLKDFSYSLLVDSELLSAEIKVNLAYVKMMARKKWVTSRESQKLQAGLKAIEKKWHPGNACRLYQQYEDVHTFIQQQLEKKVGPAAKKLHTGRSRNDLVVTSTRVYLKEVLVKLDKKMVRVQKALLACARRGQDKVIPGLTHLKKAQPVSVAHHFLAYVEMLNEDRDRLHDARKRMDVLSLGSAALGGSSLPIDQKYLAKQLGFKRITTNSLAAVSDRAFLVDVLSALTVFWMHLSRFSEDMILWNSEPFHYIELDDAFATGSSLMPQKKNPDIFELIRGYSATVLGALTALVTLQKGLPLSYNRDLQEDKPGLFRVLHKTDKALEVLAPALSTMRFCPRPMDTALEDDGLYATDILEYLIQKKIPFSEAHEAVGKVVSYAQEAETPLSEVTLKEWKKFSKAFDAEIYRLFDPQCSVRAKKTVGSTHPGRIRSEIKKWEGVLTRAGKTHA